MSEERATPHDPDMSHVEPRTELKWRRERRKRTAPGGVTVCGTARGGCAWPVTTGVLSRGAGPGRWTEAARWTRAAMDPSVTRWPRAPGKARSTEAGADVHLVDVTTGHAVQYAPGQARVGRHGDGDRRHDAPPVHCADSHDFPCRADMLRRLRIRSVYTCCACSQGGHRGRW
ncbi:hypothetical protein SMALA_8073 [Streptomyces malaysiensis subsp. malaysiensis]|nr:hypothetical protein SMALA_8073 [Streptomyces malaysiensis]